MIKQNKFITFSQTIMFLNNKFFGYHFGSLFCAKKGKGRPKFTLQATNTNDIETLFLNACFDKTQLKNLIAWILESYGEKKTLDFLEKLKYLGFHEATKAGVSLGLEDLQIPTQKTDLIAHSVIQTNHVNTKSLAGNLTGVEKSQQMIDIWNQLSDNLRQNAIQNFRIKNPVNPVFMMAFSGARGNISQVRQLVAMRGLMADPQGAIVEFPIQSNFREGLTITEYLISCYGARKGVVDTALRTATSGYLTRRLVDAVQHIVVTLTDCQTSQGVFLHKNLESRLVGRVLAENLSLENNKVLKKNQLISPKLAKFIADRYTKILVRSPLTCQAEKSICQLCYGEDLAHGILVNIGEAVGVIAAQSIGEPGTQLTMRTFHTGGVGVFAEQATKPLFSPFDGVVEFPEELVGHFVRTPHGNILYMVKYRETKPTRIVLTIKPTDSSKSLFVVQEQELPPGSLLLVRQHQNVKAGQLVAQASQIKTSKQELPESLHPILSPSAGEIFFESMVIRIEKKLPPKTKKQKDESFFPDIRTLNKLGSFWVFSSFHQQESHSSIPFVRPGDLVSQESFLVHYKFKVCEKTQLQLLKSKLIVGQGANNVAFRKIRFHKFGYSLEIPTFAFNQTFFYVKNLKPYSTRQFLIWFPFFAPTRIEKRNRNKAIKNITVSSFFSYLTLLKNYNLHPCFSFVLKQNSSLSSKIELYSRAKNLLTPFSSFRVRKNKFYLGKNKKFENKKSPCFSFFYNRRLFQTQFDSVGFKNFFLTRKFFSQNLLKQNQNHQFLEKTLTNSKFKIFDKVAYSKQACLSPKTTWIFLALSRQADVSSRVISEPKMSKFIVVEQGKNFENVLFSNSHINIKILPSTFFKIYPFPFLNRNGSRLTNFLVPKFSYSKSFLIHHKSVKTSQASLKKSTLVDSFKATRSEIKSTFSQIEKRSNQIIFYSRNKNFDFKKARIELSSQNSFRIQNKIIKKTNQPKFVLVSKIQEQVLLTQNEVKTQWLNLQFQNKNFDVCSPLVSKQYPTAFTSAKKVNLHFDSRYPSGSGWVVAQKSFQVNVNFDSTAPFLHVTPKLKFLHKNVGCQPPATLLQLFFYDFLSFYPKQKFQFQTFANGWLLPKETLTNGFVKIKTTGEYRRFEKHQHESISSIVDRLHLRTIKLHPNIQNLAIGEIFRWGQEVFPQVASVYNGRIIVIKENLVLLRLGIPFLASSRGILHVYHNDLIQENSLLVTLKSRRLQTEDIVQGIPKIEQLFEARETQGGEILTNNLHILLQKYFNTVRRQYPYSLDVAVSKSVSYIQQYLVENILEAYSNQGVKISEKHVEIVVKQMTTKVRILKGGETGLVQGEIVELAWMQEINKKLKHLNREQAIYEPIVLGISKSVLQSESFLLAASFQEVARVLVRSALSRKTDFLRGLHENVILGQRIPAGTGLLNIRSFQISSSSSSSSSLSALKS